MGSTSVFNASEKGKERRLAGEESKGNRDRTPTFLSFAYTQTIICLYANDHSPIRKRSCAYTQIETFSNSKRCYPDGTAPLVLMESNLESYLMSRIC